MTSQFRTVSKVITSHLTKDGAGVSLRRAFSRSEAEQLDPFLLLDHFGADNPEDYLPGFPWHPHRGIETVTYMMEGIVDHMDSIGNQGSITPGDVQWMTAGGGILHQEMPRLSERGVHGFQLWVNLPSKQKMMQPRYRDVKKHDIPAVSIGPGSSVKVIAGEFRGVRGPVKDLVVPVQYFDVVLKAGDRIEHVVERDHNLFAFLYHGEASFGPDPGKSIGMEQTILFNKGEIFAAKAGPEGARFLLASGPQLNEPIAWGGPIVMNTNAELQEAFFQLDNGTFIDSLGMSPNARKGSTYYESGAKRFEPSW